MSLDTRGESPGRRSAVAFLAGEEQVISASRDGSVRFWDVNNDPSDGCEYACNLTNSGNEACGDGNEDQETIQAAMLELVLPILPHRLNDDWRKVIEREDVDIVTIC